MFFGFAYFNIFSFYQEKVMNEMVNEAEKLSEDVLDELRKLGSV